MNTSNESRCDVAWESLPMLPDGSGNFIAGTIGNDLILAGGIRWKNDVKEFRDAILRFDGNARIWRNAGNLLSPVAYSAFGQTGKGFYFVGGSDGETTSDKILALNHRLECEVIATIPNPLCYSAFGVADEKLFVVGGGTDVSDLKTLTDLFYSVDLKKGKVTVLPDFPGGKLVAPTGSVLGGQLYVFAGATLDPNGNGLVNSDAAFVYSISENYWRRLQPFPFPVRGLASCTLDERYIFLGGGYGGDFLATAFIYDTEADSYSETKPLPYPAMVNFVKAGRSLYCLGGEDKMRHRSALVYRIEWRKLLPEKLEKQNLLVK